MAIPMGRALEIRDDLVAHELRGWAPKAGNGRASARAYAIANALDGLRRAAAARLAGMERQGLRDAVVRDNAEGLAGLYDRPKGRPARRLDAADAAALAAVILKGPEPAVDGGAHGPARTCAAGWRRVSARATIFQA